MAAGNVVLAKNALSWEPGSCRQGRKGDFSLFYWLFKRSAKNKSITGLLFPDGAGSSPFTWRGIKPEDLLLLE